MPMFDTAGPRTPPSDRADLEGGPTAASPKACRGSSYPRVVIPGSRTARSLRWPVLVLLAVTPLVGGACTAAGGGTDVAGHPSPGSPTSPAATGSPTPAVPARLLVTFRTAPASFDSPVQPDNRPNGVAGDTNGLMPSRDLVGVAPGCQAARAAAPSL